MLSSINVIESQAKVNVSMQCCCLPPALHSLNSWANIFRVKCYFLTLMQYFLHMRYHCWGQIKVLILLISFWGMSCVFLCIFVCMCVKCIFASLCIFVETFVRAWLSQAFLAFLSCPQYHVVFYAFVLMYDIGIKFDMIWLIW